MTIGAFADQHRLELQCDPDDGTDIIRGREGHSHIFEYSDDLLAVMVMPCSSTARRWKTARAAFESSGMIIRQAGDDEGTTTFDPAQITQVRLAMKYAKVKTKVALIRIPRQWLGGLPSPASQSIGPRMDQRHPPDRLALGTVAS
jgi:hypothetical protein